MLAAVIVAKRANVGFNFIMVIYAYTSTQRSGLGCAICLSAKERAHIR
jgi:hypothetical protein